MYRIIVPLLYFCDYPDSLNLLLTSKILYNDYKYIVIKQRVF